MRTSRPLAILSSIALSLATSSALHADTACGTISGNLITNCSFETGSFSGWNKVDPSDYSGVDSHNPESGTYAANLGAEGTPGTLSQTVTDIAGAYYAFTFSLENEVAKDAQGNFYLGGNSFVVSFTNDLGNTYVLTSDLNIPESSSYTTFELFFFGTGTDTITFTYLNIPSYFDLDNVSVVDPEAPGPDDYPSDTPAVPEPSSLVLMGTGVLSLAGVTRRKFQKVSA
jgi:hypothetical protein